MKKIIALVACGVFTLSSLMGISQTDKKSTSKKEETKTEAPAKSTEGQKLKKDGTPDKRYKENKEAKQPATPTKKDGTPDKRYKENKTKKK